MKPTIVTAIGFSLALAACGGAQPEASSPEGQPVVEIETVGEEVSDRDTEPAPASRREARNDASEKSEVPAPYPEEIDSPWAQPPPSVGSAVGTGGPECDRAADCCMKFVQKNGPDPSLLSMCAGVRQAPTSSCQVLLGSFRQLAPQIGVQCN